MREEDWKVVIIDDDEVSINMLQFELDKYPNFFLAGVAKTGISGMRLIEKVHPDVLFLDIELPDMQGVELLSRIKVQLRSNMRVVFYTAYNKYMIEALRNQAFDFLQKPIDPHDFRKLTERLIAQDLSQQTVVQGSPVAEAAEKKFMIVTPTGDLCFLRTSEIGFFRYVSERKIWEAVLSNGKVLPLKRNITAEQLRKFDSSFIQVHQSFIINLNYLMMVQDGCCLLYPPFEKETGIILSKKYRKEMMERFYSL